MLSTVPSLNPDEFLFFPKSFLVLHFKVVDPCFVGDVKRPRFSLPSWLIGCQLLQHHLFKWLLFSTLNCVCTENSFGDICVVLFLGSELRSTDLCVCPLQPYRLDYYGFANHFKFNFVKCSIQITCFILRELWYFVVF